MPPGAESRAAASKFFGGVLGLEEVAKPPDLASNGGVWIALPDSSVQLHLVEDGNHKGVSRDHPALQV